MNLEKTEGVGSVDPVLHHSSRKATPCLQILSKVNVCVKFPLVIHRAREDTLSRTGDVIIGNPHVMPLPGRSLNDPAKWDQYLPEPGMNNTSTLNGAANVDYLDYMDMIIMDASNLNLPRAKLENGEKTV